MRALAHYCTSSVLFNALGSFVFSCSHLSSFAAYLKSPSRLFLSSSHQGTHYNDRPPPLYSPPTPLWFPIAPFSLSAYCIHAGGYIVVEREKEKRRKARKRKRIKRKGYTTLKERKHEERSPLVAGWVGVYCYCVRAELLLRRLWQVQIY